MTASWRRRQLAAILAATVLDNPWIPHDPTLKQAEFLLLPHREILYGGSAGGGKSDALLMAALQYVDVPGYSALLLRRTLVDLALPGALMDRAHEWLHGKPAKWNGSDKTWTFPSGATLTFGYLDSPSDKQRYQSSEFQFIGFDELTHFAEAEYTYLFSRLRRTASLNVPLRMRAASNPGGIGHDWVRRRFLLESSPSRRFVRASLYDNPHLDQAEYVEALGALDSITKAQLLDGDWEVQDERLLPYETILACQADCLWPDGIPPRGRRRELYVGMDVGRTKDLSVIWTWERIGDVCWTREICCLENTSFKEQKDELVRRLSRDVVRCAIDKGGIGYQLVEELEREFPGVVEGVQMTSGTQGRMARRLAVGFNERRVRIPDDPTLREDLRLVRKTKIVAGVDRVETLRSEVGHADRFWAAALGYEASASGDPPVRASLPRAYGPSGVSI